MKACHAAATAKLCGMPSANALAGYAPPVRATLDLMHCKVPAETAVREHFDAEHALVDEACDFVNKY